VPFKKEKASDELKEVPKMVQVFNGLCEVMTYSQVLFEENSDDPISADWSYVRMQIANTLT